MILFGRIKHGINEVSKLHSENPIVVQIRMPHLNGIADVLRTVKRDDLREEARKEINAKWSN